MHNNVRIICILNLLFIQTLLTCQQNTQICILIIKLNILWYFADFQIIKNQRFIFSVILKVIDLHVFFDFTILYIY